MEERLITNKWFFAFLKCNWNSKGCWCSVENDSRVVFYRTSTSFRVPFTFLKDPALFTNKPYFGNITDIWSFGVVFYHMLTGTVLFHHARTMNDLIKEAAQFNADRLQIPKASDWSVDLLRRILEKDREERITLEQVFKHPFVTNVVHVPTGNAFFWEGTEYERNVLRDALWK